MGFTKNDILSVFKGLNEKNQDLASLYVGIISQAQKNTEESNKKAEEHESV